MAGTLIPNLASYQGRNFGDTADLDIGKIDASDRVVIGGLAGAGDTHIYRSSTLAVAITSAQIQASLPIRLDNLDGLVGRNAANTADVSMIRINGSDEVEIGGLLANISLAAGKELIFNEAVANDAGIRSDASGHLFLRSHANASEIRIEAGNPEEVVAQFGGAQIVLKSVTTTRLTLNATGIGLNGNTPIAQPTYGAPTGTATRTTFATSTVTVSELAERVKAMIDDFRSRGDYA